MKSSLTNLSTQIFPSYIRLNQQVTVFRKYISTIFPTYVQQHATKFNKCLSQIYLSAQFSDLYRIKSTSECLSQIYQHNFSDLYIITILTSNCLSQIYQHNFSDIYTIKSTSECLSQIYQHNFSVLYTIKSTSLSQIFPTYILLNQQVTVSQKSFHNRLNNETFRHIQKKLKYLLRRRSLLPGKGREGNRLNIHSDNIYTRSRKILLQLFQETVKGILAHAGEYIKRQAVSYYLSKSCSGHRRAICNYLPDISCRHTVKEQFWKFRSYVIDV